MEVLKKVRIGMSRTDVVSALGPPDAQGGTSRKYKTPSIYKYGEVELHFEPWRDGRLVMAYIEDADGNGRVLLK